MKPPYVTDRYLKKFIADAIKEDIGDGDHSSISSIPANQTGSAKLLFKENGVVAGLALAEKIYHMLDPGLHIEFYKKDGDSVKSGDLGFLVTGTVRNILSGERLILNCLQRMSGIATYTNHLCKLLAGTKAKILDTRKTTPNLRPLEKWAVRIGGGTNHRFGLFDMIMLKDNHVDYSGGICQALQKAKSYVERTGKNLRIEIETRTLEEVKQALECGGADVIMLDNMSLDTMRKAVEMIDGHAQTEASGGITEKTIAEIARTGVDYISIGALTHSVKSLDISLKADIDK